mmetsp:Transcript_26645/g.32301  ORF Transcript_26645/g.32301 Transcript_26645/m.32301 type:complete len:295 (+) Transcript_26645:155-1039(+)
MIAASGLFDVQTPVNWKALAPSIIGTIAIILSLHVTLSCKYVSLLAPHGYSQDRGVWYVEGFERVGDSDEFKNVCTPYPTDVHMDGLWQWVRAFTLFGGIIGSGVSSFLWSCMFSPLTVQAWRLLALACIVTAILQGLTMMFVHSNGCLNSKWVKYSGERSCTTTTGFDIDIAATVFWIATCAVMMLLPPQLFIPKVKDDLLPSASVKSLGISEKVPVQAVEQVRQSSSRSLEEAEAKAVIAEEDGSGKVDVSDDSKEDVSDDDKTKTDKSEKSDKSEVTPVELLERDDLPEVC